MVRRQISLKTSSGLSALGINLGRDSTEAMLLLFFFYFVLQQQFASLGKES
jgi:hypothetical protein